VLTQILIFDGFDELDALAPFEVLTRATEIRPDFTVQLATLEPQEEVTGAHGAKLRTRALLSIASPPDVLVVPGGGWAARSAQGVLAETKRGAVPAAIAGLHRGGRTLIASVCTGAMLLASAGILRGRNAVTHHVAIADLAAAGAQIVHARVVDDGEIVTAGGVTSGLDLALWLLERLFGAQVASAVEERLEYERRGTVWRRPPEAERRQGPVAIV